MFHGMFIQERIISTACFNRWNVNGWVIVRLCCVFLKGVLFSEIAVYGHSYTFKSFYEFNNKYATIYWQWWFAYCVPFPHISGSLSKGYDFWIRVNLIKSKVSAHCCQVPLINIIISCLAWVVVQMRSILECICCPVFGCLLIDSFVEYYSPHSHSGVHLCVNGVDNRNSIFQGLACRVCLCSGRPITGCGWTVYVWCCAQTSSGTIEMCSKQSTTYWRGDCCACQLP